MQPTPAHDDWNRHWGDYAESDTHSPAQAYRRKLVLERLRLGEYRGNPRVLELGSGQGDLAKEIKARHPEVELLGLDASDTGLGIARRKVPAGTFLQQDFTEPFSVPERFVGWATHAICSEVLEHVEDPAQVLANARRCLAPGARLVVTVPAGPRSAFDRHIGHRRHFTPRTLEAAISGAGLDVETAHAAGFPFFNLYRLAMVARGPRLINDVAHTGPLPFGVRAAMLTFSLLFELNSSTTPWGWQLVAVAREPERKGKNS
jgi:SAM-dependent methyltransferase